MGIYVSKWTDDQRKNTKQRFDRDGVKGQCK